jgi:hypothetical protein
MRMLSSRIERSLVFAILLFCTGASSDPEHLSNRDHIRAAKHTVEDINIRDLPLKDYPLLSKFTRLKKIKLYSVRGGSATDEHLKAIAKLKFTNLIYIDLNNCRSVTDKGIEALASITSLKQLPMEATAITDTACEIIGSKMALTSVIVANCKGVTKAGLHSLAKSDSLTTFRFSADRLTQDEVLELLGSFKNLKHCEIVDPQLRLDGEALKAKGAEREIRVFIRTTGARGT